MTTTRAVLTLLVLMAADIASAQVPYTIESGDGCSPGRRLATLQELGAETRRICNRMAPDHVRRLSRAVGDTKRVALFGLKYGCDVREFTGAAGSSLCVEIPGPTPPAPGPGSSCPTQPSAFGPRKAPIMAPAKARVMLATRESLRNGEVLVSANRGFFAIQTADGNLQIHKGSSPLNSYGLLWQLGARAAGQYFTTQQADGNFCMYSGVPENYGPLVWCTNKVASGGQFFTILEDDGNLCTYKGTSPTDGSDRSVGRLQLWCSGATSPAPWLEGVKIANASGVSVGSSFYFGPWQEQTTAWDPQYRNNSLLWLRPGTEQRWVLGTDGTIRWAADRAKCVTVSSNGYVILGECKKYSDRYISTEYDGWEFCTADNSIRNRHFPKGCLVYGRLDKTAEGVTPSFQSECTLATMGPDTYGGAWNLQW